MTDGRPARNPGPSWGMRAVVACDRLLPEPLFRLLRRVGAAVALVALTEERRNSRHYLSTILGRPAGWRESYAHFSAFTELLVLKLRVAHGLYHEARWAPGPQDLQHVLEAGEQALLGSMHLGNSDITGFVFARRLRHPIAMVRERRSNAGDVDRMLQRFGGWITMIWVNDGENLLFALKNAIHEKRSVAMKCDRPQYSAKTDAFRFLGASRQFPTTIYHLAIIFGLPVVHAFAVPGAAGGSIVYSSTAWRADAARPRAVNLESAHAHFQSYLELVESVLRQQPYQWFNFVPLNPEVA